MKKLFLISLLAAATLASSVAAAGQTAQSQSAQPRLIGEVTALDSATGNVTVRPDAGGSVVVSTDDKTTYLRLPPGETSIDKAERIAHDGLRLGDRVLVRGGTHAEGHVTAARQVIVMGRDGPAGRREGDDWRARGVAGRVTALDPSKNEITILTRTPEGTGTVTLVAAEGVRIRRFAPDSARPEDAVSSSFAELRVGDQVRAVGGRGGEGTRFTPEEIIAGRFTRVAGNITAVDPARGEFTVRDAQSGQTVTVAVGRNSTIRRITGEVVKALEERRRGREQRAAEDASGTQAGGRREERARRGEGRRGGRNVQQLFESLPTITVAELRKGDAVLVTGTPGADESRVTAMMLVTGEADFLRRLQGGPGGLPRNLSPGLPSDVMGGGTGSGRDQP